MNICFHCSVSWRYDVNHTKSGVVTFGESIPIHSCSITEHEWILGNVVADELNEYKNLGVVKNYVGSFSLNVDENIEKTLTIGKQILSSTLNFGGRLAFPLFCLVVSFFHSLIIN